MTGLYENGIVAGCETAPNSLPAMGQHQGVFVVCTTGASAKVKDATKYREGSLQPLAPWNSGEASTWTQNLHNRFRLFGNQQQEAGRQEEILKGVFPTLNDRFEVAQCWSH